MRSGWTANTSLSCASAAVSAASSHLQPLGLLYSFDEHAGDPGALFFGHERRRKQ
jgi:hypothetical protein